jgi:acetyltransferase-like isoleucine patch superfamily enzyme
MSVKNLFKKIINIAMDMIYLNPISIFYFDFKLKFISPRINKVEGKVAVNKIKNKGKDLRIHGNVFMGGLENLKIGDYVRIGSGAFFYCQGGLTIGNNVQFSRNVLIYTSNHNINSSAIPYDRSYTSKPVKIGNSVWIGMNVVITPGTTIEDGAIIGMGTVVSGIVPKGAIVVGQKTRIVGYRDMEDFYKKDLEKKYFGLLFPDN